MQNESTIRSSNVLLEFTSVSSFVFNRYDSLVTNCPGMTVHACLDYANLVNFVLNGYVYMLSMSV